jgi:hypothetical protein
VGERGLADLAGAEQGYRGLAGERLLHGGARAAKEHACILNMARLICKDMSAKA